VPSVVPPQLFCILSLKSLFHLQGYATHIVGKWHLGYNKWAYTPTYRGFDTFYGYYNGAEDHYSHKVQRILDFRDNKEPVKDLDGKFGTFVFAEVNVFLNLPRRVFFNDHNLFIVHSQLLFKKNFQVKMIFNH